MAMMHVWPERGPAGSGEAEVRARIEVEGHEPRVLWYRYPKHQDQSVGDSADPLLVGVVQAAMHEGHDVTVHGTVSPSLLQNLVFFQDAWSMVRPDMFRRVELRADDEREVAPADATRTAISGFSGGVDACFTAYRHVKGANGIRHPYRLEAGLMVGGFEIPLEQPEVFARALARSRRILDSLELETFSVTTNFRSLGVDWTPTYGSALASCLMLFQERFSIGLIAQGLSYDFFLLAFPPEGSSALTDHLLSSERFRVVADGAGFHRADKIATIGEWPGIRENLRVCWAGPNKDRNCCKCEKCVRNIIIFRMLGLGLPPAFEHDVEIEDIDGLASVKEIVLSVGFEPLLHHAREHGISAPWVEAVERMIRRNRRLRRSAMADRLWYYRKRLRQIFGRAGA